MATLVGTAVRLRIEHQDGTPTELTFGPELEDKVRELVPILAESLPQPTDIEVAFNWVYDVR